MDGVAAGRGNNEERWRVDDEGVILWQRAVNPSSRVSKAVALLLSNLRNAENA